MIRSTVWAAAIVTNALIASWLIFGTVMLLRQGEPKAVGVVAYIVPPVLAVISHVFPPRRR